MPTTSTYIPQSIVDPVKTIKVYNLVLAQSKWKFFFYLPIMITFCRSHSPVLVLCMKDSTTWCSPLTRIPIYTSKESLNAIISSWYLILTKFTCIYQVYRSNQSLWMQVNFGKVRNMYRNNWKIHVKKVLIHFA